MNYKDITFVCILVGFCSSSLNSNDTDAIDVVSQDKYLLNISNYTNFEEDNEFKKIYNEIENIIAKADEFNSIIQTHKHNKHLDAKDISSTLAINDNNDILYKLIKKCKKKEYTKYEKFLYAIITHIWKCVAKCVSSVDETIIIKLKNVRVIEKSFKKCKSNLKYWFIYNDVLTVKYLSTRKKFFKNNNNSFNCVQKLLPIIYSDKTKIKTIELNKLITSNCLVNIKTTEKIVINTLYAYLDTFCITDIAVHLLDCIRDSLITENNIIKKNIYNIILGYIIAKNFHCDNNHPIDLIDIFFDKIFDQSIDCIMLINVVINIYLNKSLTSRIDINKVFEKYIHDTRIYNNNNYVNVILFLSQLDHFNKHTLNTMLMLAKKVFAEKKNCTYEVFKNSKKCIDDIKKSAKYFMYSIDTTYNSTIDIITNLTIKDVEKNCTLNKLKEIIDIINKSIKDFNLIINSITKIINLKILNPRLNCKVSIESMSNELCVLKSNIKTHKLKIDYIIENNDILKNTDHAYILYDIYNQLESIHFINLENLTSKLTNAIPLYNNILKLISITKHCDSELGICIKFGHLSKCAPDGLLYDILVFLHTNAHNDNEKYTFLYKLVTLVDMLKNKNNLSCINFIEKILTYYFKTISINTAIYINITIDGITNEYVLSLFYYRILKILQKQDYLSESYYIVQAISLKLLSKLNYNNFKFTKKMKTLFEVENIDNNVINYILYKANGNIFKQMSYKNLKNLIKLVMKNDDKKSLLIILNKINKTSVSKKIVRYLEEKGFLENMSVTIFELLNQHNELNGHLYIPPVHYLLTTIMYKYRTEYILGILNIIRDSYKIYRKNNDIAEAFVQKLILSLIDIDELMNILVTEFVNCETIYFSEYYEDLVMLMNICRRISK